MFRLSHPGFGNKGCVTAEITYSSAHVLTRSLLGRGLLCAVLIHERLLKGALGSAREERGGEDSAWVLLLLRLPPGREGRRARGSGGPSSPERPARPGVRDSGVSADSRRLPLPPPGDRPRPASRTASPVSLTLACHSGSPSLLVCYRLCILYADLSSQVMFSRLV